MASCIPTAEAHSVLLMGSTTDLGTLRTQSVLQQRQAQVADAARRLLQSETMVSMLQEAGVELPSFEELEMCRRRGLVPGRGDWRSAMSKGHAGATPSEISGDGEGDSEGPPVSPPEGAVPSSCNTTPLAQPGMSPPRSPRRMTARGGWRQHVNRDDAYEKNPVVRRLKKLRHKVLYGKVGEKAYARYKAMLRANITWRDILRPNLAATRKSTPKRGFSRWLDGATTDEERRVVREDAAKVIQTAWRAFKRDRIDNVMQHVKNFEMGKYNWSDDDSVNTDELPDWWGGSSSSSSEDESDKKKKKKGKKKNNSLRQLDISANSNKKAVLAAVASAMDEENMAEAITDANSKRKKKKKKKSAGDDGDGEEGGEEAPPAEPPPEVVEPPQPTEEDSGGKKKGKGKKGKGKKEAEDAAVEDAEGDKGTTIAGEDSKDASLEAPKAKGVKPTRTKRVITAEPDPLVNGLGDSEVDVLKGLISAPPAVEEQHSTMMESELVLEPEPLAPQPPPPPLPQPPPLPLAAIPPPPPLAEEPKPLMARKGKKGKKQEDAEVLEAAVVTLPHMELPRQKPEPPPVEVKPGSLEPAAPSKEPPRSSLPGIAPAASKPPPPPATLPNISPVTSMAPSPEASILISASVSASDVGLPAPTFHYSTDDDASRYRTSTVSGTGAGSAYSGAGASGAGDNEPEDYKSDNKKKKRKKRSPRNDTDEAAPSTTFVTTYTTVHTTTTPRNRTTGLPDWSKVGPSPDLFDAKTDPEKRAVLLARMAREGGPEWRPPGVIAEWLSASHYLYEGSDPDKRAEAMAKVAAVMASSGQALWKPPGVSAMHWVSMSKSMYDGNDPEKRAEAMMKVVNATPLNPMWRPPGMGPGIGRPRYDSGLFDEEPEKPSPQEVNSDQPPWRPPGVPHIEYYNYYATMDSSTSSSSSSSSEGEGDVAEKEGGEGEGEGEGEGGEVMTPEERAARRAQQQEERRAERRAARAQAAVARINGRQPWRFTYAVDEDTPIPGNEPPQVRYENIVREEKCAPRPWKYTVIAEHNRSVPYNIWGPYVDPNKSNCGQQRSPRHESLLAQATKRLAAEASASASTAASPSRIRSLSNTISGAPQTDSKSATDATLFNPTVSATDRTDADTTREADASTQSALTALASPDITATTNTASDPTNDGPASGTGTDAVPFGDPSLAPAGSQASTGAAASGTAHGASQLEGGPPRRARVQVLRRNVSMSQLEVARGPGKGLYGRHSARHVGRLTTLGCAGSGGAGGSPTRSLPAPLLLQQQPPLDAVTSLISVSTGDAAGALRGLPYELSVMGRPAGMTAARPTAARSVLSGLGAEDSSEGGSYSGAEPSTVGDEGDVHRARAPFLHRQSPIRDMEASNEGSAPAALVTVTADGCNEADGRPISPLGLPQHQHQALPPMPTPTPSLSVQTLQPPAGLQPQPRASASGAQQHQHSQPLPPPHVVHLAQHGHHHVLTHSELSILGQAEDPAGPTPTPQISQSCMAADSSAAEISEPPPAQQQPGQQSKPEGEPSALILHTVLSLPTPPCTMPEGLLAYVVSHRRRRRRWQRSYGGESNSDCESPSGRRGPPMLYPPALSSSAVETEPRRICSARGQGAFSTAGIQPYPIEQDLLRSLPFHLHVAKRSRSAPGSPPGFVEEHAGVGKASRGVVRSSNVGDGAAATGVDASGTSVAASETYVYSKYSNTSILGTATANNVSVLAPSAPVMLSRDDLPPLPAILQDQDLLSRGVRLTAKRQLAARGAAQPNPREMFELLFLGCAARQEQQHEQQHNNSLASSAGGAGSPRVLSPRRKVPAVASNLSSPISNTLSGLLDAHVRAHTRLGASQAAPPSAALQRAPLAHGLGVSSGLEPPPGSMPTVVTTSSWALRERASSHVITTQRSVWQQQPQQHPHSTAPVALLAQVGSLPPLRANSLPPLAHGPCPPSFTTSAPLSLLAPGGPVTESSRWSHTPVLATGSSGPVPAGVSFGMQPSYTQYTISVNSAAGPGASASSDLRAGLTDGISPLKSNSWRDMKSPLNEVHARPPSWQTPAQLGQGHVAGPQGQAPGRMGSVAHSTTGSCRVTQEGAGQGGGTGAGVAVVDERSPANTMGPVSLPVQNLSLSVDQTAGGGGGLPGSSATASAELMMPSVMSTVPIPAVVWKVLPPISTPSTPQTPVAPVQQALPPQPLPPKPQTPDQVLPPPSTPPTMPPQPLSQLTLGQPLGPAPGPPPSTPSGRSQRPSVSPATYLLGGMSASSTIAPRVSTSTARLPAVTGSRRGTVSPPGVHEPSAEAAVASPLGSLGVMEPIDQAVVAQRRKARGQLRTGRAPLGPPLASRVPERPPGPTSS